MDKTIVICDADSILYSTSYSNKDKSLEEAIENMDFFITQIASACNAESILLCLTKGPNYRDQFAVTKPYKGNRKDREYPIYYQELRAHMKDKWKAWIQLGFEADDLIFIARTEYSKRYLGRRIILATNDKDCLQYPGIYIDYRKMLFNQISEKQAQKSFWEQMIVGDTADNITGIEGSGPKAAELILVNADLKGEEYSEVVLRAYIKKYGEKHGIERFYESYKLLKLLDSCEEAGLELNQVPEPLIVDYGSKDISEGS